MRIFTDSSAIWGYLADRIRNRKVPMLFGLVLLSGATVFLCVATNIAMFLVGRALQGLSAALTWTVGLALVVDTVDPAHIGMAMGWIGAATSLGIMMAPLLGGVVYGKGGYYAVFAMCFGLLAVDIVLRLAIIEVKEARKWLPSEYSADSTLASPAPIPEPLSSRNDAIQPHAEPPSTDPEKGSAPETPQTEPPPKESFRQTLLPLLGLLRKPRLLAALWGTLVHSVIQTSLDSTLPLLVETTFHWNSIGAGLIFLPLVLPCALGPLVGMLGDRYGPKWLATAGFFLAAPFLVCTRFVEDNSMAHKIMLCGLLVGLGLAIVLVFGPLMAEITWSVVGNEDEVSDEAKNTAPYAQAYGLYNVAFSGGAMIGPIMGGMIREEAGWPTVGWAMGIVAVFTAVVQLIWVGHTLKFWK